MAPDDPARVRATSAAEEAIARVSHEYGAVALLVPGTCGAGKALCLPLAGLMIVAEDPVLGTVAGAPVYSLSRPDDLSLPLEVLVDVEPGLPDGFSLPAGEGRHFVSWLSRTALDRPVETLAGAAYPSVATSSGTGSSPLPNSVS